MMGTSGKLPNQNVQTKWGGWCQQPTPPYPIQNECAERVVTLQDSTSFKQILTLSLNTVQSSTCIPYRTRIPCTTWDPLTKDQKMHLEKVSRLANENRFCRHDSKCDQLTEDQKMHIGKVSNMANEKIRFDIHADL